VPSPDHTAQYRTPGIQDIHRQARDYGVTCLLLIAEYSASSTCRPLACIPRAKVAGFRPGPVRRPINVQNQYWAHGMSCQHDSGSLFGSSRRVQVASLPCHCKPCSCLAEKVGARRWCSCRYKYARRWRAHLALLSFPSLHSTHNSPPQLGHSHPSPNATTVTPIPGSIHICVSTSQQRLAKHLIPPSFHPSFSPPSSSRLSIILPTDRQLLPVQPNLTICSSNSTGCTGCRWLLGQACWRRRRRSEYSLWLSTTMLWACTRHDGYVTTATA
jgi:hypothetical protein